MSQTEKLLEIRVCILCTHSRGGEQCQGSKTCSYSPLACSTSLPLAAGKAMLSSSAAKPSSRRRLDTFITGVPEASVSSTTDLELSLSTTFTVNTLSFTSLFMQQIPSEVHAPKGGFTPKKSHSVERF